MPPSLNDIAEVPLPKNGVLIPFYIPTRHKPHTHYTPLAMRGKLIPWPSETYLTLIRKDGAK